MSEIAGPPPRRGLLGHIANLVLGKAATLILAACALTLGIATFVVLAGRLPGPEQVIGLVLANLISLLLLGAVLAGRLTRMWMERRRGAAGARLHVRLVLLFSGVALTPTIVVAVFSTGFFNLGIHHWFAEPVRTALQESLNVSRGYLEEHRNNIRADALAMAADLSRAARAQNATADSFADLLNEQTALRGLTEAVIFEPETGQIIASSSAILAPALPPPPGWAVTLAHGGEVVEFATEDADRVRALVQLDVTPAFMLSISRPVDARILQYMRSAEEGFALYKRLDENRSGLQLTFALIFALLALLVLAAAILIGLVLANQIARPVGGLIAAAEKVRGGDLTVRVPEWAGGDELVGLARAFNRMTGQLGAQRGELLNAYAQLDERRHFTEAVLSGVSAGVIGLDADGAIELPNRAASVLLGRDLRATIGQDLAEAIPEFAPLLAEARAGADSRPRTAEVQIGPPTARRTLLLRIGADADSMRHFGFVATFDDITELQSAQRKAAWADVARRIAHEIKNPLTPIQLSAERLKRRFTKEITSDPETFASLADTIVRHVGDIGRMVDEFSSFARMPQPVMQPEDVGRIVRESLILQRNAHPEIDYATALTARGPVAKCDRRLIGQALTNLLQNAADAIAMRGGGAGRIAIALWTQESELVIEVADDGLGLPGQDRDRLTEPYVTHKPKGTGLGLAIVKKIMEDHGGRLGLAERLPTADWPGSGAVASLVLPYPGA